MNSNRNVIIILALVVVILAIVAGILFFQSAAKEASALAIESENVTAGDYMIVKLTDSSGNPISDAKVKIRLTDEGGINIGDEATTNVYGKAKFKIEDEGKYSAECSFEGNGKFASSSTSGNINVEKAATKLVGNQKTTKSSSGLSEDGYSYYPEYGPDVDSAGVTREYAIKNNWHYIEMRVDGDRPGEYITVGGYVPYDAKAGCYHT